MIFCNTIYIYIPFKDNILTPSPTCQKRFSQPRCEASFRSAHARCRSFAEGISFYGPGAECQVPLVLPGVDPQDNTCNYNQLHDEVDGVLVYIHIKIVCDMHQMLYHK